MVDEHQIRLRKGWLCRAGAAPESEARWLELPVRWKPEDPQQLVLVRRFGRPAQNAPSGGCRLVMDQVAGISFLTLNGQVLGRISAEIDHYKFELNDLAERNILVVHLDKPATGVSAMGDGEDWGIISLVVRTMESGGAPLASPTNST